jgi:hypothetical protein
MTSSFVDDDVAAQASEQEVAGAGSCDRKRAMRCGRDRVCGDEVKWSEVNAPAMTATVRPML